MNVTVLMAPMCSATSVSATLEGLESANILHAYRTRSTKPIFSITTASLDGNPVVCTGGLTLTPKQALSNVQDTELVIIPGFLFQILQTLPNLVGFNSWLNQQYQQGATIAAMCTGTFMLAESGILDHKQATTHWYFAEAFKQRYPLVKLQENNIITEDERVICSGGASAGSDLLLHLIRRYASNELAAECSKKLLIDTSRRKQTPYVMQSFVRNHNDEKVLEVQLWLDDHYTSPLGINNLAEQFGFGQRNFKRRFKDATGQNPVQYLQNLRLEKAKYLLEVSKSSIKTITYDVGYEDSNSFCRLFKERVGITPGAYRKKFQFDID